MKNVEDQTLVDYLLGVLPEDQMEQLDELSLSDDDLAERLDRAEDDLVDAYVNGDLSAKEREQFQSNYLASPRRRKKVKFAETFQKRIRQEQVSLRVPSSRLRLSSIFARPGVSLQWGLAAAAVLLLIASSYLMLSNLGLRNEFEQMQAEQRALEQREQQLRAQLSRQPSGSKTEEELLRVRGELERLEQQLAEITKREQIPPELPVTLIAFHLSPQTRGISKLPTLKIAKGTELVALTLKMETNDFPVYKVALKNPGTDEVVWRSENINPDASTDSILAGLPVSVLKSQNYLVELYGVPASGGSEIIGGYPFRVVME